MNLFIHPKISPCFESPCKLNAVAYWSDKWFKHSCCSAIKIWILSVGYTPQTHSYTQTYYLWIQIKMLNEKMIIVVKMLHTYTTLKCISAAVENLSAMHGSESAISSWRLRCEWGDDDTGQDSGSISEASSLPLYLFCLSLPIQLFLLPHPHLPPMPNSVTVMAVA